MDIGESWSRPIRGNQFYEALQVPFSNDIRSNLVYRGTQVPSDPLEGNLLYTGFAYPFSDAVMYAAPGGIPQYRPEVKKRLRIVIDRYIKPGETPWVVT